MLRALKKQFKNNMVDEESKEMLQFGLDMIFDKYISFY